MMVVDASIGFEIEGMKMSMKCSGDMSKASYFSRFGVLVSLAALVTLSSF